MTQDEILLLVNKLTDRTKREAGRISKRLESGAITQDEWREQMAALLASSHIVASSVGRGGRQAMTAGDWAKVEKKVEWQEGFLPRFGRAIVAGAIVGAAMLRRATMYAEPIYVSYARAFKESKTEGDKPVLVRRELNAAESCDDCIALADLGFIPVDEMPEIGSDTSCGNFCKCEFIFSDDE